MSRPTDSGDNHQAGVGLASIRFFIAVPLACAAIYSGVIAITADNLRTEFSMWKSYLLIGAFGISSVVLGIGSYKSWMRKPHWGWWFVASMVAYILVAQMVRSLR